MVQDAAYFIAEKNGFESGSMDYWIAAEAEIAVLLSGKGKKYSMEPPAAAPGNQKLFAAAGYNTALKAGQILAH